MDVETLTDNEVLDVIDMVLKCETIFYSTYCPSLNSWIQDDDIIDEYDDCDTSPLICTYCIMLLKFITPPI